MKQATSQETVSDSSHSQFPKENESNASGSSIKSAAMLGIALSVGASGAMVPQADASASVTTSTAATATKAFSSDSKVAAVSEADSASGVAESSQQQIADLHTVESGESLWQIAQQHGVGLRDLKTANALPPETSIRVGQVLKVPGTMASNSSTSSRGAQLLAGVPAENAESSELSIALADELLASDEPATIAQTLDVENLQASSLEVVPEPAVSIEIEIENASQDEVSEPVVTALATPAAFSDYQVQLGDTLGSIASSLGTTPEALIRSNSLANPDVIFVGSTLRVPSSPAAESTLAKTATVSPEPSAVSSPRTTGERLAYLRSTATRPDAARILEDLRSVSPEEALSVGGEQVTEQDVLSVSADESQSVDPYVANLMEEVQEIRSQSVEVSEAEISEVEADTTLLARSERSDDRPSLLSTRGSRSVESDSPEVNSDLLAAAPLSPSAYVPAQRSSAGQVVSPDMPILPSADEYLPEAPNHFDGYIWPTQGTVTSGYGWRWGRMHRGVDVAGPVGTPIVAAAAGVVEQAGWNSGGYGNLVEIRHPDGSMTRYAHNNSLNVSAGQTVRQGQQIAEMGSTGYSTGPHLHFELHQSGGAVNPVAYLPSR
ncbi:MAG: peptidoglycan DD-metalloendopeptidase family protein [Cyanobacteria bacterium P01_F01_bin.53]